ncbi:SseB family protein [Thalassococcus lentus]|uniref:SseB family protein n=1 Tax=Thalassococcus lentus TaxID=1210524 RepID=A0ABT4XPX1_9RHOB|nr:SseB family protein [Thalassococcus lentus]MDA7423998.1 SseB family protein [Thalassococcus lentus]
MTETPLDRAHAAMEADPTNDTLRLRFYDALAAAELFLMLAEEPQGGSVSPEIFDVQDARFVLAFDLEERLSAFAGKPVPYAALSGRALAQMLSGQGIGLALNLEVAPSAILLPDEALGWLMQTLSAAPTESEAKVETLAAPRSLPEALLTSLDAKLAAAEGLARKAYLAEVTYEGGAKGHLLGITGAPDGAQDHLVRAINEALVFSGLDAGALDVAFLRDSDPLAAQLAGVALRFDLPQPQVSVRAERVAPGTNPDKPPKLR